MSWTWSVRGAQPDDAAAIAEIHVSAWQVAYRGLVPQGALDQLAVGERQRLWARQLESRARTTRTWVACWSGQVLGFAHVGARLEAGSEGPAVELEALYVRPNTWRRGAGRALLEAVLDEARRTGVQRVSLWVFEANRRARRFYEACGLRFDGDCETRSIGGADLPTLRYVIATEA